jgi:hypothetical protein
MSIPDGLAKYVISGTMATGKEIFACSFWVSGWVEADFPTDTVWTGTIPTNWSDFLTAIGSVNSSAVVVTAVDGYYYSGGAAVKHAHSDVSYSGTGTPGLPSQSAIVLTTRTPLATRSGRGRIYIPVTKYTVLDGDGMLLATNRDNLVDKFAALLTFWNSGGLHPVVVSQTTSSTQQITSVDADRVIDTQRRRRSKLTTTRHAHSV